MKNWEHSDIQELSAVTVHAVMKYLSANLPDNLKSQLIDNTAEREAAINKDNQVLALLPTYTFCSEQILLWIKQQGFEPDCIQIGTDTDRIQSFDKYRIINLDTQQQKQRLIERLDNYKHFLIITPALNTIGAIANSDDSSFNNMLVIRPLLWGRPVTMLLDFELPKHRRAFTQLADSLNTLEQMGVSMHRLEKSEGHLQTGLRDLITANDVEEASRRGQSLRTTHNAIITQLALDTAGELGVVIE